MHLAELNIGRLVAPTDDPRVAEFMQNLDRINGLGKRMPGFVWMMEGSGEPGTGNTEAKIGGDPQYVSNLTVWEDAPSLRNLSGARSTNSSTNADRNGLRFWARCIL